MLRLITGGNFLFSLFIRRAKIAENFGTPSFTVWWMTLLCLCMEAGDDDSKIRCGFREHFICCYGSDIPSLWKRPHGYWRSWASVPGYIVSHLRRSELSGCDCVVAFCFFAIYEGYSSEYLTIRDLLLVFFAVLWAFSTIIILEFLAVACLT